MIRKKCDQHVITEMSFLLLYSSRLQSMVQSS